MNCKKIFLFLLNGHIGVDTIIIIHFINKKQVMYQQLPSIKVTPKDIHKRTHSYLHL